MCVCVYGVFMQMQFKSKACPGLEIPTRPIARDKQIFGRTTENAIGEKVPAESNDFIQQNSRPSQL